MQPVWREVHWREMQATDVAQVNRLGSAFHIHHPEGDGIATERQRLAPGWCFVLTSGSELPPGSESGEAELLGYCVSHPWSGPVPPGLDTLLGRLPETPECLHVHDLVLVEAARGQGLVGPMLSGLWDRAVAARIPEATLIAVGEAGPFWAYQGFSPDVNDARIDFVRRSYGSDATPMRRVLQAKS